MYKFRIGDAMVDNLINLFKNRLSNNILTLSGELIITSKDTNNKLLLNDFDKSGLKNKSAQFRKVYPDINVELFNGLTEIDVKFFAHGIRIASENFLEEFNEFLIELIEAALDNGEVIARLNVFGKYSVNDSILSYRYLNKKNEVKYIIVDEEQRSFRDKVFSPIVVLVFTLVLSITVGAYSLFSNNPKDDVKPTKIEQNEM